MRYSLLLIIALILQCGDKDEPLSADLDPYSLKYEITGTASSVDITYENSDGGTSQVDNATLPWTYSFEGYDGRFVYVSAQNQGSSGDVTVTIYKDDAVFKTSTSSGAYVIATASGSL